MGMGQNWVAYVYWTVKKLSQSTMSTSICDSPGLDDISYIISLSLPIIVYHPNIPGLVNVYRKLWKDPPCYENGKIHDFDWAIFNSYVTDYQRVLSLFTMLIPRIPLMLSLMPHVYRPRTAPSISCASTKSWNLRTLMKWGRWNTVMKWDMMGHNSPTIPGYYEKLVINGHWYYISL